LNNIHSLFRESGGEKLVIPVVGTRILEVTNLIRERGSNYWHEKVVMNMIPHRGPRH
jgi:hypothetical protein